MSQSSEPGYRHPRLVRGERSPASLCHSLQNVLWLIAGFVDFMITTSPPSQPHMLRAQPVPTVLYSGTIKCCTICPRCSVPCLCRGASCLLSAGCVHGVIRAGLYLGLCGPSQVLQKPVYSALYRQPLLVVHQICRLLNMFIA